MKALVGVTGAAAVLGALGTWAEWNTNAKAASEAYLFAYAYVFSIVVGALFVLMIGHACEARWFVAVRRMSEHVVAVLPLLAVLFVPVLVFLPRLYPWMHLGDLGPVAREYVSKKVAWLNPRFFVLRAIGYQAVFVVVGELLRSWSVRQDGDPSHAGTLQRRMVALGAGGLFPVALALTFASFDWFMSLEPAWYSNLYGVYVFAGGFVSALGLLGVLAVMAGRRGRLPGVAAEHYHAIGRLELAMIIFWTYIAWAQLLLYWIADLPLEVTWYVNRWQRGWQWVGVALVVLHWGIPFFFLLLREPKRRANTLFAVSLWIVIVHLVDVYYLLVPAFSPARVRFRLVDLSTLVFMAALSILFGLWRARGVASRPVGDPAFEESLEYEAL